MKKLLTLVAVSAVATLALTACKKQESNMGPAQKVGAKIDKSMGQNKQKLDNAMDKVSNKLDQAKQKMNKAYDAKMKAATQNQPAENGNNPQ